MDSGPVSQLLTCMFTAFTCSLCPARHSVCAVLAVLKVLENQSTCLKDPGGKFANAQQANWRGTAFCHGSGWAGWIWSILNPLGKRGDAGEATWGRMGRWVLPEARGLPQDRLSEGLLKAAGHAKMTTEFILFYFFSVLWYSLYKM